MPEPNAEAVLITGVFGSGKSSLAAEITYLLEQGERPYALLDLDYLGWVALDYLGWAEDHEMGYRMMLRNLAAVAANYRDAGVDVFVLAYFVRDRDALRGIRDALGVPLRVVRLAVPLPEIERRLAADVMSGRRDDLRYATASLASGEGLGFEDLVVDNDRPLASVAREVTSWLGWL